jgi:uncharacterized protein (TIGR03000 family)
MFHKAHPFHTLLVLTGAALFVTALPCMAAGHGGGFGGHGGGFGGYHGHFGGYHGYSGLAIGHLRHYGYYNPHAYQSRYLYYPFYGGAYPWYDYQPYYGWGFSSGLDNSPTYSGLSGPDIPDNSAGSTPQQPINAAHVTVNLPADAELWFNGTKMKTTGRERAFYSPELMPGRRYTYEVRARWKENGHEVTQTRTVNVSAGAWVYVNLSLPPATPKQAEAKTVP